jgi:anti-sigma factor RsiW
MPDHLSAEQIDSFLARRLPPGELLSADDHLAICERCRRAVAVTVPTMGFADLFDDHPDYALLESFADGKAGTDERHSTEAHLAACAECRAELAGITEMRDLVASDLAQSPAGNARPRFVERFRILEFAFGSLLLALLAGGVWWFTRAPDPRAAAPGQDPVPNVSANSPEPAPEVPRTDAPPLTDGRQEAPDEFDGIPERYRSEVRAVVAAGRLEVPSEARELSAGTGTLMSGAKESIPFALVWPVGKIVESDRPTFRWRALEGADGYRIDVFDADFSPLASSQRITETRWTPPRGLPRGRTVVWQVTAFREGEEVRSPIRPAPDARVKILDAARASELAALRRDHSGNHLLLGIKYAKAGLLEQARSEFRKELKKNPGSTPARKLLRSVR